MVTLRVSLLLFCIRLSIINLDWIQNSSAECDVQIASKHSYHTQITMEASDKCTGAF